MLRVKIELVPYGDESRARTLQTLTIVNTGGTPERGTYTCTLTDEQPFPVNTGVVENWPRLERDAAALVHEALRQMGYGGQQELDDELVESARLVHRREYPHGSPRPATEDLRSLLDLLRDDE